MSTFAISLVDTLCEKAQAHLEQDDVDSVESLASEAIARDPGCNRAHQLMVRVALVRGEIERAQTLLNRWRDLPVDDVFVDWGLLAEELDDLQAAGEIYQAHLAQYPHDAKSLFGLAMLHVDRNERGLAQAMLQTLVQHHADHVDGVFELGQLYEEDGMMGLAQELYGRVLDLAPDHARALAGKEMVSSQLKSAEGFPSTEIESRFEVAARMVTLFAGRKDVYARQWIDDDGKAGYVPVREALTVDVMKAHLQGDLTVGVYPIFEGDQAHFLALDIDIKKEALNKAQENDALMDVLRAQVCKDVRRICAGFGSLKLPVCVEDSGHKGAHVWLFFDRPVRAAHVRKFGRAFVKRFGPLSEGLQWELFPKQDAVGEDELGNLIKLPLGVHRKTGRRALFVDLEGRAVADQGGVLLGAKTVAAEGFREAVSRLVGRNGQTRVPLEKGDLEKQFPEFQSVLKGCAVIRSLVEKAFATGHLAHNERHVLKCVFGHVGKRGRAFLHAVVGACADYNAEVTDYQIGRLHPHPIGCPKIRKHLPDLVETVPCACDFDLPKGGYPSPVLHIDPVFTEDMGRADRPGDRDAVDRYVALRQQAAQIRTDLAQAEDMVRKLMRDRNGTVSTGVWIVTADDKGQLQVGVQEV